MIAITFSDSAIYNVRESGTVWVCLFLRESKAKFMIDGRRGKTGRWGKWLHGKEWSRGDKYSLLSVSVTFPGCFTSSSAFLSSSPFTRFLRATIAKEDTKKKTDSLIGCWDPKMSFFSKKQETASVADTKMNNDVRTALADPLLLFTYWLLQLSFMKYFRGR